jgi:23S rRNA pseudouridine1911/1915/1917 synthase
MIEGNAITPATPIKLSAPATKEFWEIPVVFEDEHLLAINKPARLLTSPDRYDPARPNLIKLLHAGVAAGKPWARDRGLTYLANAHRLDFETTGVLLLAKNKPSLVALANLFGSDKPRKIYVALVQGTPEQDEFEVDAPIAPHPTSPQLMRVEPKRGKKSTTQFTVLTKFRGYTLLQCHPLTGRTHQIRIHLRHARLPILGDHLYRGGKLFLSEIKRKYRPRLDKEERPLISTVALHAESLTLPHPITGQEITIKAPWPKDLEVAVKYLKMFAGL